MPLSRDLLHPSADEEKSKHKLKRLVQSPNSYFMDVKCPGCYKVWRMLSIIVTFTSSVKSETGFVKP